MLETHAKLASLLKTIPRSKVAMDEARRLTAYIKEHNKCYNCGVDCTFLSSDLRYNGVCKHCGAVYSRMQTTKSKIISRQWVGMLALTRYRENLSTMSYLPASLRGSGTIDELVEALDDYIYEVANY